MRYFLVLEKRPGDFMPININILLKDTYDYTTLQNIDSFTNKYSAFEIKKLIEDNNLVGEDYLKGNLCIINDNKYRYKLLSREVDMSLDTFFEKNIKDKQIMNKFINIYLKYTRDHVDIIKDAIKNEKIDIILQALFMLPYETVRNIYFYLYDNCLKAE